MVIQTYAHAETLTFAWNYNKYHHSKVTGYRLYMSTDPENFTTVIADIPKADVTVFSEKPILIEEHFDTAPGTKYNVTKGSWSWVEQTKNMLIDSDEFMVVFEVPAGVSNDMSFFMWPKASKTDAPIVYSYLKDEPIEAYYELRLGGANGIRYSNWRKVYDMKFGGVNGAFALPRFAQCQIKSEGETICPGFWVGMTWTPDHYSATVMDETAFGDDDKPLNINKLEIIVQNESMWIDNIIIGGQMELRKQVSVTLPATGAYFVATAYNQYGESGFSVPNVFKEGATEPVLKLPNIKNLKIIKSGD